MELDSSKISYIKNKPNLAPVALQGTYESLKGKPFGDIPVPFENLRLEFSNSEEDIPNLYFSNASNIVELYVGEEYIVNWDGKEFYCTCKDAIFSTVSFDGKYIGNSTLILNAGLGVNTGEPFVIFRASNGDITIMTLDKSAKHDVSLMPAHKIKKLDKKYLPDDVGSSTEVNILSSNIVDIFTEQELTFEYNSNNQNDERLYLIHGDEGSELYISLSKLKIGEEYYIVWNGTEYKCIAQDIEELVSVVREAFSLDHIIMMFSEDDLAGFFMNKDLEKYDVIYKESGKSNHILDILILSCGKETNNMYYKKEDYKN